MSWGDRAMERRTVLKLVAAGVLPGTSGLVQIACTRSDYRPEFFSVADLDLLDALTEVILPADDHSPGARAAKVARYIDVTVADSAPGMQERWREGLRAVSERAEGLFGCGFADCGPVQQDELVAEMARNEGATETDLERFFALVKQSAIEGYYTSQIGIHEDLGYAGNTAIDDFPGCTHTEHA